MGAWWGVFGGMVHGIVWRKFRGEAWMGTFATLGGRLLNPGEEVCGLRLGGVAGGGFSMAG